MLRDTPEKCAAQRALLPLRDFLFIFNTNVDYFMMGQVFGDSDKMSLSQLGMTMNPGWFLVHVG